jgi:aminopeptidase N
VNNVAPTVTYLQDYQVPDYLIEKVDLEFTLEDAFTIVKSKCDIRINPAASVINQNLVLVGDDLELVYIALDRKILSDNQYKIANNILTIFNVPKEFTLEIETRIKPQANTSLSGLYLSNNIYCTQCESEGFRHMTYFLDRPDVMSRYTVTINADQKRYPILLSNGNLIATGQLDHHKHWVKWEDPFKKPCYLFALVAGDLEFIEDFFVTQSGRCVTLRIYVEKGNRDKCTHAMEAVKKAMRWDEEKFGREYDLDNYMIVAVNDFNAGAMENKGLNIFNTKYILASPEIATDADYINIESVIAHEYFHNWTGNRITCRDWFQLSLKEGLTIFRDQSFTADTTSKAVARINDVNELRDSQFPEDGGPLAHPVRPDSYMEISNFYTATIYNKGAEVIRMMQSMLGEEVFRKGMDLYFAQHDGQAVTIEEFVKAMEDAGGVDLTQFRLWYSQAGTPLLTVRDHYDAQLKTYTLNVEQSCPATPGQSNKQPFQIPVKMALFDFTGKKLQEQLLDIKLPQQEFQFNNIATQPVPSLLRDFSAPVKLDYNYSDEMLQLLFKHDDDLFNRWEAGQHYAVNLILRLIKDCQQNKALQLPKEYIQTLRHLLQTMQSDKLLLAEMLALPSEKYIGEQMAIVDVEAIHVVREFVLKGIASELKEEFKELYRKNHTTETTTQFNMEEVGRRRLKNLCLTYLMYLGDADIYEHFAMRQFKEALTQNMTDTLAALHGLANSDYSEREAALDTFYHQWKKEPLVVDKWFAIQASSKLPNTLENVKQLLQRPVFDIKNPNKVYSLIGAFGRNPIRFHEASGAGYEFLAEFILQLDVLNPHVAARMIKPLTDWKRYDAKRQMLMRQQLEHIFKNKKLSKDVYEIVHKSLELTT